MHLPCAHSLQPALMNQTCAICVAGKNAIQGTIPDGLRNLTRLAVLMLDRNPMHGSLPQWLGNLSSLQVMSLNSLEGGYHIVRWLSSANRGPVQAPVQTNAMRFVRVRSYMLVATIAWSQPHRSSLADLTT